VPFLSKKLAAWLRIPEADASNSVASALPITKAAHLAFLAGPETRTLIQRPDFHRHPPPLQR
jgi:hypothetical protein